MNKTKARDIIENVFSHEFDRTEFINFANTFLFSAHFDPYIIQGNQIPEQYKEHIGSLEKLAAFTDSYEQKIDLLIVTLLKDTTLDRARTMQRNFVARYLSDEGKDAALIAFACPESTSWRFSLIKMELNIIGIKVEERFTPAKRWSFLVGENEAQYF